MSDERLREAERRWLETRSVDDEARFLRERVRVGGLAPERLELAAYCGHAAAREEAPRPYVLGLDAWARGLEAWGLVPMAFAAVECASLTLPAWRREFPGERAADDLVELARRWVACPCDAHRAFVGGVEQGAVERLEQAAMLRLELHRYLQGPGPSSSRIVGIGGVLSGPARLLAQDAPAADILESVVNKVSFESGGKAAFRVRLGRVVSAWALG